MFSGELTFRSYVSRYCLRSPLDSPLSLTCGFIKQEENEYMVIENDYVTIEDLRQNDFRRTELNERLTFSQIHSLQVKIASLPLGSLSEPALSLPTPYLR